MVCSFFPQGKSCRVVTKYAPLFIICSIFVSESYINRVYLAFREDSANICSELSFCRNLSQRLELTVDISELHPCFRQFVVCSARFSSDAF